jgi:hypothetical protein
MSTKRTDDEIVDLLAKEAKESWLPGVGDDVDAAERKLFARIDDFEAGAAGEHRDARRRAAEGESLRTVDGRFWGGVAAITAIAAGVAFFAHPRAEVASSEGDPAVAGPSGPSNLATNGAPGATANLLVEPPAPKRPTAPAELAAVTGGGELRVNGASAGAHGASLRDGEVAEARGGVAVFQAPGRVDWLLESGTEVAAVRAGTHGGAIVLGLRSGAVEAQVTPVAAGEAFAVDVEGVRVAVHGTHLRVAREERQAAGGTHVVVDLSEGVILVGTPPKAGATVGTLVYAPAHVEFSVGDLEGTWRVSHDASRLRAPVDPALLALSVEPPRLTAGASAVRGAGVAPNGGALAAGAPRSTGVSSPKPPSPGEIVMEAVRTCSEQTLRHSAGAVTISSTLSIHVGAGGVPSLASFDPPVDPAMQDCVAAVVYGTRWNGSGEQRIPIELHK